MPSPERDSNSKEKEQLQQELRQSLEMQQELQQRVADIQMQMDELKQKGQSGTTQRGAVVREDNEIENVAAVTYFKLIPFWNAKPQAWFSQVESIMRRRKVTTDMAKYDAVVEALDQKALDEASDILAECPDEKRYDYLKQKLIKRFSESAERQLHKFLSEIELGDKKPSQLLRQMKDLVQDKASEELVRTRWTSLLPLHTRNIVKSLRNATLADMAEVADAIVENQPNGYQVMAVEDNKISRRLDKIEKTIEELLAISKKRAGN